MKEWRERITLVRQLGYLIYEQNPYIKPPRAHSAQAYWRFPWEEITEEEAREAANRCRVTDEEAAALNRIFEQINQKRDENRRSVGQTGPQKG